jgi:negative regulator of sigma E activity
MQKPTDEQLMAFADGELPPDEVAVLERQIAADRSLQARVEAFRSSRLLVGEALKPLGQKPVPSALEDSIRAMIAKDEQTRENNVVSLPQRPRKPVFQQPWALAAAASVAAVVVGLGSYSAGWNAASESRQQTAGVGGPLPDALADVLNSATSGNETHLGGDRVRTIATVRTADGGICREFEIDTAASRTMVGIACHDQQKWRLDVAVSAPPSDGGYAPASSLTAIDSYLEAIGASEALSAEEEVTVLESLREK